MLPNRPLKVGIVGATGAVGIEIIDVLHKTKFLVKELILFASSKSAGKSQETPFGTIVIQEFDLGVARACDLIFLAVTGEFALENAPKLIADDGPVVIDNSSAFRYMDNIPLVVGSAGSFSLLKSFDFYIFIDIQVPEVNADALTNSKLIANPNCTTAIAAVVLWPLHLKYGIKKLIVSSYQAASGAGAEVR